jgi:hypothetical protein
MIGRAEVVVCENSNVAKIYTRTASGFELTDTLAEVLSPRSHLLS